MVVGKFNRSTNGLGGIFTAPERPFLISMSKFYARHVNAVYYDHPVGFKGTQIVGFLTVACCTRI